MNNLYLIDLIYGLSPHEVRTLRQFYRPEVWCLPVTLLVPGHTRREQQSPSGLMITSKQTTGQRKLTHTHPLAELGITSSRAAQGHGREPCPNKLFSPHTV